MRRRLVVAKLAATCASIFMAVIAITWPNWIELVFGSDSDHGNGLLEILIVGVLIAAAFTISLAAKPGGAR